MLSLQNPDRFVWDFWYYFEFKTNIFHVFFLNADRLFKKTEGHHFNSEVGYATTEDFISFEWISNNILCANKNEWFNTSIWTGDIIQIETGFLMYFTSRDEHEDDGLTQNIGVAYSENIMGNWNPIPKFRIKPFSHYYTAKTNPDDLSIHAWRDPYLFMYEGVLHMLLTAKTKDGVLSKNGCIALLRSINNNLLDWETLPPVYSPGFYSEMEVSQIYKDNANNFHLVFSSPSKYDFTPTTSHAGGLHSVIIDNPVESYLKNKPEVLMPFSSNIYAGRIIPELNGEIVGFDKITGGLIRSGIKTEYANFGRDFAHLHLH